MGMLRPTKKRLEWKRVIPFFKIFFSKNEYVTKSTSLQNCFKKNSEKMTPQAFSDKSKFMLLSSVAFKWNQFETQCSFKFILKHYHKQRKRKEKRGLYPKKSKLFRTWFWRSRGLILISALLIRKTTGKRSLENNAFPCKSQTSVKLGSGQKGLMASSSHAWTFNSIVLLSLQEVHYVAQESTSSSKPNSHKIFYKNGAPRNPASNCFGQWI